MMNRSWVMVWTESHANTFPLASRNPMAASIPISRHLPKDWIGQAEMPQTQCASLLTNKAVTLARKFAFCFLWLFSVLVLRAHKIQINDKTSRTTRKRQRRRRRRGRGPGRERYPSLPATFAFHCQNANLASSDAVFRGMLCSGVVLAFYGL